MGKTATWGERLCTSDGSFTMRHGEHGEPFHSLDGALSEARGLYVAESRLEELLGVSGDDVRVLDVGLGLGYNALATIDAWAKADGGRSLHVVSVEIAVDLVEALASGSAPWQAGWDSLWVSWCCALKSQSSNIWTAAFSHPSGVGQCQWTVSVMDGRSDPVPQCPGGWTHVWQDPFSPDKNPGMWTSDWLARVREACASGAILMSYSVARPVKDALTQSGWSFERIPAHGRKREWLRAKNESRSP